MTGELVVVLALFHVSTMTAAQESVACVPRGLVITQSHLLDFLGVVGKL